MILDVRELPARSLPAGATIVVGSGAAGLALALALGDAGTRVVLLESGGDVADPGAADRSAHLNDGVVDGLPFDGLVNGRARVLGGTTELWHGQCMRLHEIDLRERDWVPGSGWPIDLTELADHYEDAERWLGVTGLGYGESRWSEHPRLPPLQWDRARLRHDFTEYTPDPFIGRRDRSRLAEHADVHVVLSATAAAVRRDADGRASGVEVVAPDLTRHVVEGDRVVLAAGAIENARLLALSDPEGVGLGDGREHTGRYLQDHPIIRTARVRSDDPRVLADRYIALHRGRRRLFPKVRLAPGAQEEDGLLDATAVFVHEYDDPSLAAVRRLLIAARSRRMPEGAVRDLVSGARALRPAARDAYRRYARGLATGARPESVWLQLWLEQLPDPQSRVTLAERTDALGLRQARIDWRCSDQEIATSRALTRWIGDDLQRLGVGRLEELAVMTDDVAWRSEVGDAAHPAGTTRMARSPQDGVVDPDLAVFGVPGLYVVGGSVFPIAGYANPTLTIVALALRLARHLTRVRTG